MPDKRGQSNNDIAALLEALNDSGNAGAWASFLDQFAPTLMRIARQYAQGEEEAHDCFLHVCEKLCADGGARLQRFESARRASFGTWLVVVANNLSIDWHRSIYGRSTIPAAVRSLPELERFAYQYRFEQNLDLESCLLAMRSVYPGLDRDRLTRALAVVHTALSPRQRWKISARTQRGQLSLEELSPDAAPQDPGEGPLRVTRSAEVEQAVQSALSRLSPRHRLVLRLRYEQELSLDDVARVSGLNDLHQARRLIQAALRELQDQLAASGFRS